MTLQLKKLSKAGVPGALEKAERYRFLNEPTEAESICLDILQIEPDNQKALVNLILSISDQYAHKHPVNEENLRELVSKLTSKYEQAYYSGIIAERRANAKLEGHFPGAKAVAFDLLQEAMHWYEEAEKIRPEGNDNALLRWNTCVRIIERHRLSMSPQERVEQPLE